MSIKFKKLNVLGSTIYRDTTNKFTLIKNTVDGKYYIHMNSVIPSWNTEGFNSVEGAQNFLSIHDWNAATETNLPETKSNFESDLVDFLLLYGFSRTDNENEFLKAIDGSYIDMQVSDVNSIEVRTPETFESFNNLADACLYIDYILNLRDSDIFSCVAICNPSETKSVVNAAISSRDLSKNLVRVKSSNMWAYTINIREYGDKVGDVLVQFKAKNGGPGDIYMYYDVPVSLWRRWLSAPSKGHFFWQYVRNVFRYRKLTGDKRGKLANAVN